jgi:hypothetical protein
MDSRQNQIRAPAIIGKPDMIPLEQHPYWLTFDGSMRIATQQVRILSLSMF